MAKTCISLGKAEQLVRRHGSLTYEDPEGYHFDFALSLEEATKECVEAHE